MRVKSIGTLGVIARKQGAVDTNKVIGQFLLGVLQELPPKGVTTPDSAIEALNAIYDIYADADFDYDEPVFIKGGFLSALKAIVPAVKSMVGTWDLTLEIDWVVKTQTAGWQLLIIFSGRRNQSISGSSRICGYGRTRRCSI